MPRRSVLRLWHPPNMLNLSHDRKLLQEITHSAKNGFGRVQKARQTNCLVHVLGGTQSLVCSRQPECSATELHPSLSVNS